MSWRELGHGSSPLARGLRERGPSGLIGGGIIPARAGFTRVKHLRDFSSGDHPRSRGVYARPASGADRGRGSSPLARGLQAEEFLIILDPRIIPARAGFTLHHPALFLLTRDHPRSRGVYMAITVPSNARTGSSPLARGLPRRGSRTPGPVGIIPARAGFTLRGAGGGAGRGDHPRSRGVYRWS